MSIKIKINWDNENVVSESVRIYRADSAFTSTSLPLLLTEIVGNVYEYEDLTTVEDQTYFYMLSAKLGDEEIFTECFEVAAKTAIWLDSSVFVTQYSNRAASYHGVSHIISTTNFGISLSGTNKWSGSILAPNGKIYCAPNFSANVLIIDPVNNTALRTNFGLDLVGEYKFSGSVLAKNGKIYCIPNISTKILIIDPSNNTAELTDFGLNLSGTSKFRKAFADGLGNIYMLNALHANMLRIDTISNTVQGVLLTSDSYASMTLAQNGKMYAIPDEASTVAIFEPKSITESPHIKFCLSPHINKT